MCNIRSTRARITVEFAQELNVIVAVEQLKGVADLKENELQYKFHHMLEFQLTLTVSS